MSTRFSRRRMLAGMAALPALALLGCESDRTTGDPISTVDHQPHNFHVHGVTFQIVTAGATRAEPRLGWADTVLLAAEATVQLAIKFPPYVDPLTPYMYHCHLMWHEDVGMMAQFTVVDPDQVNSAPRTLEVDQDHRAVGHDHG